MSKKFSLDLSKFKKTASDQNTSTLKHEDGHEIKIDHKKLSPALKKKLDDLQMDQVQKFDEGGEAQSASSLDDAVPNASVMPAAGSPESLTAPGPDVSTPGQAAQLAPPQAPPPAAPPAADPNDPYGMNAYGQQQLHALGEQRAGAEGKVNAEAELARGQQEAEQAKQTADIQAYNNYDYANSDILASRKELMDHINTFKLNPQRYIENMSTGSKIGTGLGLILGGMGAGLTHGPNLAFQYLQNQIGNDIDAQKADLGKSENLLSHNLQATGDLRQAYDLTRIHTNDILSSQMKQLAAKAQTPIAQANLLSIAGQFDQQSSTLQHGLAVQKALMNSPQGNAQMPGDQEQSFQNRMQFLRMNGNEQMAKDMEAKHAPGIGQSSVPLSPENRNDLEAKQNFQNKLEQYIDFAKKNSGSLDPRIAQEGAAKSAELQGLYRQATHGGVYKEGEADFINKVIDPNPTKFFNNLRGVIPKAQELSNSNKDSLSTLKKSVGLPAGSSKVASATPEYKISGGVKYMKGPNGEAIKVK